MASEAVVNRLQQRAETAEKLLATMRNQINTIKSAQAVSNCAVEEAKLREENAKLRTDIAAMKEHVIQTEAKNGLKQLPIPAIKTVTAQAVPSSAGSSKKELTPTTEGIKPSQEKLNINPNGQENKKEKKEKKESKAKAPPAEEVPVDVSRLDLRVGRIVNAKRHPDADSLYVEEVDVGDETTRTILSGLVKHVPIEQMQDRLAVFCCNLKPAKMRGILSQGMIMCASSEEKCEIIDVPSGSVPGDRVTFDEYPGQPDALLNPKKKIWEQVVPDLRTNNDRVATYKGAPFKVEGKGLCIAPTAANSPIK